MIMQNSIFSEINLDDITGKLIISKEVLDYLRIIFKDSVQGLNTYEAFLEKKGSILVISHLELRYKAQVKKINQIGK